MEISDPSLSEYTYASKKICINSPSHCDKKYVINDSDFTKGGRLLF